MVRQRKEVKWYNRHNEALWLGLASLVLAYIVGSAGIDSGRWWEYFGTLLFLALGFNRLIVSVRARPRKNEHIK